jgi:hypothetical protein
MVHEIGCGKGRGATWKERGVQGVCTSVRMIIEFHVLWRTYCIEGNVLWRTHCICIVMDNVLDSRGHFTASHIQPVKMSSCIASNVMCYTWHDYVLIMSLHVCCIDNFNCAPLSIICDLDNCKI